MPNKIIPPAPPGGPSILAGGADPEADALLDQYLGNQAQQQAPQVAMQPQAQDPEADALLDQYMGITQNPPPPKAAMQAQTKTGLAKAPKPMISATIQRKSAGTQLQPPPPPKMQPWQIAGQQLLSGVGQAANQAVGAIGRTAASLPIVGQAVAPMAQQAAMAQQEYARDPVGSSIAALANAPRGILNLVDAASNTAQRQMAQWGPTVHKNRIAIPFNLAGAYDAIPGMSTLQKAYPGQSATGQAAGASMVPIHSPVPIENPITRGLIQGAVGGQALGSLESAGEQAKHGPVDYGKAFQAGLPVAAVGAGLGVGMGAAAKGLSKGFGKKPAPQAPTAAADIVLKDGSQFSTVEATKHLRDPATPPEVKEELRGLLESKDKEFADAGLKPRAEQRQTAFSDLGKNPTIEAFQTRVSEQIANASTQAEVRQIQSDALNYMSGRFKGPIRKHFETLINNSSDARYDKLQPKYMKVEKPLPDRDLSAEGYTGPDVKAGNKPVEVVETPEEIKARELDAEERRLFPMAGEQTYGTQKSGLWRPSELTDQQVRESIDFMRERTDLNKNELAELKALEQEVQRREWRTSKEAPPAAEEEALPPDQAPTPEPAAEPLQPPAAETPVRKPFFGNKRKYIQGTTGDDVWVTFPTPTETQLVSYARKPRNFTVEQRNTMADQLGVPRDNFLQYARDYANKVSEMATKGRVENSEMDAPFAEPYKEPAAPEPVVEPKPAAPAEEAFTPTAPDGYEMPAPQPKPQGDRFTVQKNTEKKGGYVDLIDTETGEVVSSSKRTEAQAAALAAKYNDLATNAPDKLEAELRRGSKNLLDFRKTPDDQRQQIVDAGQPVPEGHALSEPLQRVADAKQAYDESRARFESATDAFYKLTNEKQGVTMKRERLYSKDVEEMVRAQKEAGGLDELAIEVNNQSKLEPVESPRFQRGMDPQEAFNMVENLYEDMKLKEAALKEARKNVESDFLSSDLGPSVNVPTKDGTVNVRAVPKQGTELNQIAEEIRGPVPDKEYVDRTISNSRKVAKKRGIKTRRNQRGSVRIAFKKPEAKPKAQPQPTTVEESLADGAAQSKEISDMANDADYVRNVVTLRNTFDIAKEVSTDLHNELVVGIGKEALAAHGLEFKGDQAALAEQSLALEPWTIREGGTEQVDLSSMSDAQLNYLATRRSIRQRMAESVRDELTNFDTEYGSVDNMPNRVKGQYTTLQQLEQALSGFTPPSGTSEAGAIGIMRNAMYDYLFKWNGAYHALNLTDPFIVGSARVGMNRIMAAKGLLMSDPAVRAYVKGVPNETPIQQMRKEVSLSVKTPKGVKAGNFTKLKQGIAKVQSKLPDLPSERWNFEDAWLAGVIERGDRIGYEGGGTQYARDLAYGKLSPEEIIKLYADSMNTAQEITGSGSFGLNKDTIQRMGPMAKALTLFTSQPMRQARILSDIITKDMKANPIDATQRLLAFAAATMFFGGRALLPKETDYLEINPTVRPFIRGVQDILDSGKLFQEVPIIGRDLTDKLRWSMVPFLGGVQQNMLQAEIDKFARAFSGQKWDEFSKASFIWALSSFVGGGGLEMNKIDKNAAAAMAGDKKISAYPSTGGTRPAGQKKFSKITGTKYDAGQAIKDSTLPGVDKRIGAFIKTQRRLHQDAETQSD